MPNSSSSATRLNIRDVHAERVHAAMLQHADEITEVRDVLRLESLRGINGECIAVAIADLVAMGRVVGASGTGRIHAIRSPS
jgi:ABC-type methionine transport system permease subunit